jgi:hypothetical protein
MLVMMQPILEHVCSYEAIKRLVDKRLKQKG